MYAPARLWISLSLASLLGAQPIDTDLSRLREQVEAQRKLLHDWAGLIRYGSANTELPPPAKGENRVVFLGDDLTARWAETPSGFFPGKPYINRGISGQTFPQMLVRFRQDVVSLKPKIVVIQGGMNDLLASTQQMVAEHVMSLADLAKANGIALVLTSLTPVCDCGRNQTALRPTGRILGANEWLRDFAAQNGAVYVDFYKELAAGRALKKDLTIDGLLLNDAGYAALVPLIERAIAQALTKK